MDPQKDKEKRRFIPMKQCSCSTLPLPTLTVNEAKLIKQPTGMNNDDICSSNNTLNNHNYDIIIIILN